MKKQIWKPGNMLYPLPAVLVSCGNRAGETNILTVAWTGTVCTSPAMVYISVRPERYSDSLLRDSGEFVINLSTESLVRAADYCGVKSGRDTDKWSACGLSAGRASTLQYAPVITESPVNIECRVTEVRELGSHHMFLAEVTAVQVDEALLDASGKLRLNDAGLLAYSHGEYFRLGNLLGSFGYSVRKKTPVPPAVPGPGAGRQKSGSKAAETQKQPNPGSVHETKSSGASGSKHGKSGNAHLSAAGRNARKLT